MKTTELINLDEAIDAIYRTNWYHLFNGELSEGAEDEDHALYKATDIYKAVGEVQQVDAEPVRHGKWIHGREVCREYIGITLVLVQYKYWKCSACGYRTEKEPIWKYCPNCGARMDGDKNETD